MSSPLLKRGWKVRVDNRKSKAAAALTRAEIDAERQAHKQRLIDESLAAAAEAAKLQTRARCSCPVCDSGLVDLELAARIVTALAKLQAHVPTDPTVLNALRAVMQGQEIDRSLIYGDAHKGLHVPHRVYAAPAAETVAPEPATVTPKADPVVPSRTKRRTIAELAALQGDDLESVDD